MKIAVTDVDEYEKSILERELKKRGINDAKFFVRKGVSDVIENLAETEALACFVHSKVNSEALEKMPNLKMISVMSTGYDHIDSEYCKKRGIALSNVPSYGNKTVAEYTFALILAVARKTITARERVVRGEFNPEGLMGLELNGKTLGIIGTGKIGYQVAKIAAGFDMKIVAYDAVKNESVEKLGGKYEGLDDLLSISDIITIHLPLNENTKHLINTKNIEKIKKGAILVNTARGGIVETRALIKGLDHGIVSCAGLDVLEMEKESLENNESSIGKNSCEELKIISLNNLLIRHPKVFFTPHVAFYTKEAVERIMKETAENIASFAKGEPRNRVA